MFDQAFAEFGRRAGLHDFALNAEGRTSLAVDGLGRVQFEAGAENDGLLIYVLRSVPTYAAAQAAEQVLRYCDVRNAHALPVQGGVFRDNAVMLTRLSGQSVSAAAMENAVRFLFGALDAALGGQVSGDR